MVAQQSQCVLKELYLFLTEKAGPEVIKLFHAQLLSSAEHGIFSADKYENAKNSWHFHIY